MHVHGNEHISHENDVTQSLFHNAIDLPRLHTPNAVGIVNMYCIYMHCSVHKCA